MLYVGRPFSADCRAREKSAIHAVEETNLKGRDRMTTKVCYNINHQLFAYWNYDTHKCVLISTKFIYWLLRQYCLTHSLPKVYGYSRKFKASTYLQSGFFNLFHKTDLSHWDWNGMHSIFVAWTASFLFYSFSENRFLII